MRCGTERVGTSNRSITILGSKEDGGRILQQQKITKIALAAELKHWQTSDSAYLCLTDDSQIISD